MAHILSTKYKHWSFHFIQHYVYLEYRTSIYENFWAGGVKQPLNPSRHPSMDEASSEAGRTVATDSS